jgi:hypothetical protein
VVIRPVDPAARKGALQPVKDGFVPLMYAQGDVRLVSGATEMTLADQESEVELRCHVALPSCSTVMFHGKHSRPDGPAAVGGTSAVGPVLNGQGTG